MKTIELPPYAPTLIESTRSIGYSLETAVADIVDNSIAAGARNVDIFFFPVDSEYLAILDDGKGMNVDELDSAMRYGSKNPIDTRDGKDLGRFGLGLKTASLSQCRCLTVVTKQGNRIEGRCWDIDYVIETGRWSLIMLDSAALNSIPHMAELQEYPSGTLVVWQRLDRLKNKEIDFELSLGRKLDVVRDHLSLVFHRYLNGEKGITRLNIAINKKEILAKDPFLEEKSTRPMDDETMIIHGEKIITRAYILPHISKMTAHERNALGGEEGLKRQQGFYVYRNKRLLIWGTWFRMMRQGELSKLARIRVDIPNTLDELWTLDIKKSSALPPEEVRKNLKVIIERIAEHSKRTWTCRGKKEIDDRKVHLWNRMKNRDGGIYYEINREHPMVKRIFEQNSEIQIMVNTLLKQVEVGLPLNQLYVDLNNDEQVTNECNQSENDILVALKNMLTTQETKAQKIDFLLNIKNVEPFAQYPSIILQLKEEISSNG